jgi:hypothetical protein
MAGYSGTPLSQKLGITAESSVLVANAPRGFKLVKPAGKKPFDVAVVFVRSRADLKKAFSEAAQAMTEAGGVWLAWPKKSSGIDTDVTDDVLRTVVLPTGWVDNKVCAIDETYSGLRFVKRRELRKAHTRERS